ncbi:hypothetical protein [Gayadomonas joobiniege]|uniref:hypothetical protein n=1 Tax=Gayadomonas joobiniege TaxID=1234606 RepID=UPI0003818DEC|nr:hypothetical protein [Gayadomonas joobiniege]
MRAVLLFCLIAILAACKSTDVAQFRAALQQAADNMKHPPNNKKSANQSVADSFVLMAGIRYFSPLEENMILANEHQVTAPEDFSELSRDEREQVLEKDIEAMGTAIFDISSTFNKIQQSTSLYAREQYQLVSRYSEIARYHRDVQSFLKANEGKSKEEIAQAVKQFDQGARTKAEKIGPKLAAYEKANQKIFSSNAKLTALIGLQVTEVAAAISRDASVFWANEGTQMLLNLGKLQKASQLMLNRLTVAENANQLIADDKALIEVTQQIQQQQDARIK